MSNGQNMLMKSDRKYFYSNDFFKMNYEVKEKLCDSFRIADKKKTFIEINDYSETFSSIKPVPLPRDDYWE